MEIIEHGEPDFYQNKGNLRLTTTKALGNAKQPSQDLVTMKLFKQPPGQ